MSKLRMRVTCHSFCIVLVLYKDHIGNWNLFCHFSNAKKSKCIAPHGEF